MTGDAHGVLLMQLPFEAMHRWKVGRHRDVEITLINLPGRTR